LVINIQAVGHVGDPSLPLARSSHPNPIPPITKEAPAAQPRALWLRLTIISNVG
jgi:hypothetical protein